MPAEAPPVVSPSILNKPAAKATVTPTPVEAKPSSTPAPAQGTTSSTPDPLASEREKLANERKMLEIRMQRNQKKYAEDFKAKEAALAEKEAKLAAFEKEKAQAKLNKTAYLKSLYGDDWYDQIVSEKLNGGAPTASTVALEVDRLREEFDAKLKKELAQRDEKAKQAESAQQQRALEEARREVASDASRFWTAKQAEYPLMSGIGTPEQIAFELASRVEKHYLATIKRDEEGRVVADGEILPLQKVAELWEGALVKVVERAATSEKYAGKFQKSAAQPQSRTLSNDLTGTTPGPRTPPATLDEKRERAYAAYAAAARKT